MLRRLGRAVFDGLATVLPLAVTIYALWWLGSRAEKLFDGPIERVVGEEIYFPGLGVIAGFILLIVVGILARLWIARKLVGLGERVLERVPLAKTIYGGVKDMLGLFSTQERSFGGTGFVKLPGSEQKMLGLVTREDFSDFPQIPDHLVAVYLPKSYQIGGFTVLVPRDQVEDADMTVEEAMRFAMTAAASSGPARHAGAATAPETVGGELEPGETKG